MYFCRPKKTQNYLEVKIETYKRIEWAEQFQLNNLSIDKEHKTLVNIYNNLVDALEQKKPNTEIVTVLTELTDYSLWHFKHEEEWMKQVHYPDFDAHQMEHKDFIYRIAMFNLSFDRTDETMIYDIISFLREWIVHHLLVLDKKISTYILSAEYTDKE